MWRPQLTRGQSGGRRPFPAQGRGRPVRGPSAGRDMAASWFGQALSESGGGGEPRRLGHRTQDGREGAHHGKAVSDAKSRRSCWSPPGCWWRRWWAAPDAAGVTWRRSPRSSPARLRSGSASAASVRRTASAPTRRPVGCGSSCPTPTMARIRWVLRSPSTETSDRIDPVLESTICIGQNPPPTPNELIFLGTLPGVHIGSGRVPDIVPRHGDRDDTVVSLRGHRP